PVNSWVNASAIFTVAAISSSPHGLVVQAGPSGGGALPARDARQAGGGAEFMPVVDARHVRAVVESVEGLTVVERLGVQRLVPVELVHLRLDRAVARGVGRVRADRDVAPEADVDVGLVGSQWVRRPLPAGDE